MTAIPLRQGLLFSCVLGVTALLTQSAFAQDASASRPSPEITPNGPPARQDSIDAFQVRIADNEYLAGRLRVVDPLNGEIRGVRKTRLLFTQNGKVVGRGETGVSGVAQIKSLPIGAYSAIALGPDGMAAFGFEILPPAEGVAVAPYRFDALLVPAADMAVAQRSICSAGPFATATPLPLPAPPAPVSPLAIAFTRQIDGPISSEPEPGSADYDAFASDAVASPLKGEPILVRDGDTSQGQLVVLSADSRPIGLENSRVSFIRGGQIAGSVETDSDGRCEVVGLVDGIYSMVGVGTNGFIAMGVRVKTLDRQAADARHLKSETLVTALQPEAPIVEWRSAAATSDALAFAPGFACGACGRAGCCGECAAGPCGGPCGPGIGAGGGYAGFGGGGFGGAAGGGGLFGGGGGLFGALVGAGVGAAIGAAVADDGDDEGGGGGGASASPNTPPSGG